MEIKLHPGQSQIYKDLFVDKSCRHSVAVCSRGWGKSVFGAVSATTACIELLQLDRSVPNKNVAIIAPTYTQVVDIYYPLLAYQLGLESMCLKSSRDLGRFWFPNEVQLRLVSYEAVERLRGLGFYFIVNDEVSSWTKGLGLKETWQGIIQPCISTRWSPERARVYGASSPGRSLTISTPKGYTFLYDMAHYHEKDDEWKSYHFDYTSSPYLDPDEIERIKHTIDPLEFNREYLASFEESGNRLFYCFDRKKHVKALPYFTVEDGKKEDVHIAIDFNVGLMCSTAWAIRGNQAHCLDEFKGHPDTEQLCVAIKGRYPGHKIFCYPDPSGNSRKTSAATGTTDFSILRSHGFTVLARTAAPKIVDSVQAVNRKLLTAAGEIDAYFSPNCTGVITSMERTAWVENNPDTAAIDKSEGVEHYSDGVRYFFEYKWPVMAGTKRVARGFGF
jgi:hypothetical protein